MSKGGIGWHHAAHPALEVCGPEMFLDVCSAKQLRKVAPLLFLAYWPPLTPGRQDDEQRQQLHPL